MRFPRFAATSLVLVATSALAIAACGGSVPTDLFSEPGADSGATADGSSGGGNGGGGGGTSDASFESDASVPTDAGTNDAARPVDAGQVGIPCGTDVCAVGSVCCANGAQAPFQYVCKAKESECAETSVPIACNGAEDCTGGAGRICCGDRVFENGRTSYADVTCRSTCNNGNVRFCDPKNAAASCGQNGRCEASTILPGFFTCL